MNHCTNPPEGWTCSRERGHSGPCAARQSVPYTRPFTTIKALCTELRATGEGDEYGRDIFERAAKALEHQRGQILSNLRTNQIREKVEWGYVDGTMVTLCANEQIARELCSMDPQSVVKRVVTEWRSA